MPDRPSTPFAGLLGVILLFATLVTQARADNWYRVEVLVFSNGGGSGAEEWDATPTLSYPGKTRLLVDAGHPAAQAVQQAQNPLLPAAASPGYNPVYPAPFITLPTSGLEFRGAAARMQGSGRYRTLFHEAWTQPIPGRSQAIPIVLDRSGDGGPWPALQGTIKLYISRYIYLETNLWLNTAGDYLHSEWQMPPPPLAPPSVAPVDPFTGARRPTPPSDPAGQAPTTADTGSPGGLAGPQGPAGPGEPAAPTDSVQYFDNGPDTGSAGPDYPYRHAVLLSQTRRMRSNEVNYIDHPMFGVVVKVTPVTAPGAAAADDAVEASGELTQ
jgi:hypothetical protein